MNEEVEISWERFLNPAELRSNLLIASIYISGFEILKDSIADRIKSFFTILEFYQFTQLQGAVSQGIV